MLGLYIHIPFCSGKCYYCDFVSFKSKQKDITKYLKALEKEAKLYKRLKSDTLYIGGGTPGSISVKNLCKLFKLIEKNFKPVKKFSESTFEANPESLTIGKINLLKKIGIQRISLGLQSSNDKLLKVLGRRHTFKKFEQTYLNLRKMGFDNVNVDLMIGVPRQTLSDCLKDIKKICLLNPEHISLYSLQIEQGSVFGKKGVATNDDLAYKMYETVCKTLKKNGYGQYEISNFAKAGYECRHNINYWNNASYLGLGVSAVSYLKGVRRSNTCDFKTYCIDALKNPKKIVCEKEKLTGKAKVGETLMLGLRKTDGIKINCIAEKYFGNEISRLKKSGLLKMHGKKLMLSKKGLYLSNVVFREFVRPFIDKQ
ncbi:MAG TPA: radical SAM family heme chaperone HemW [Elusimicrobiales bacterium]|nr:radical SAM family heme chaperone HemW [Elusimicrobiales bacterium]